MSEKYKKCKYNTSNSSKFVGYCDLPEYKTETGRKLVKCCADNDCGKMVIE